MSLTSAQRRALPDSDFAVPGKRALPLVDERHVRMAWSQHMKAAGLTDRDRAEASGRIKARATALGINLAGAAGPGLYVRRNLTAECAVAFQQWAEGQGFINPTPLPDLHATIVYSRAGVILEPVAGEVRIVGGDRSVAPLGDKGAIVLFFTSDELQARWQAARDAGATWDWDAYMPHVTVTYDGEPSNLDDVEPFTGDLVFGPEIHEPLNETWAEDEGLRMAASGVRFEGESLEAMALAMPDVYGHPNRMPFSGILTRLGTPSDKPPGGSGGKRVILTRAAAERALPSLMGMAVNFTSSVDGHDTSHKIGIFTAASIEGDAIHVDGFIYAKDFPAEASRIQTDKRQLGFSWELADIYVERLNADPLVITDACFTGAAILRKDKAAYTSTSLAASAEDQDMTKEEIMAAVGEALGPVTTSISALASAQAATDKRVSDMAAAAELSAKEAADKAALAVAAAKDGELESLKTKVADLQAAAAKNADEPARKTLSPQIAALLAKADLSMPEGDSKLSIAAVDVALSKTGMTPVQRMEIKNNLQRAGALA